jgi:hypothetical protein
MSKGKKTDSDSKKSIKVGHYFLFDLDDRVIHARISKEQKEFEIKGQRFPSVKIGALEFGAMISDRRVYSPGDSIRFLIACPGGDGKNAHLEITYGSKRAVMSDDFSLDDYGVYLYELKGIEETGEYTATVTASSDQRAGKEGEVEKKSFKCDFTVAQHTLSPLLVQIEKQVIGGDVLDAELEATVLNQPYTGPMTIGLYCDYCRQVVNQISAESKNGSFNLKIALSGHTGPFRLEFSTPDGNTASVSLQSTRIEERQEVQVGNLGEIVNVALIPIPDGNSIRGVNWARRGVATAPVVIKSVESEKIELQVTRNLDALYVYTVNPVTSETNEKYRGPVRDGEKISFRNSAPYHIVTVGCIVNAKENKLFEGRTIVFYPEKLEVELTTPEKVEPSEEVAINLETNMKTRCLLMVFDERLDTENIIGKLGKDIYSQLTALGRIEELQEQFEARREAFEHAADESPRVGTGRMMAMPSAPPPMMKMAAKMMAPSPQMAYGTATGATTSALDAGALATVVATGMPVQGISAPRRAWFPKLIACKLIEVDRSHEERVKLGDTITQWKVQVYAFAGLDYISKSTSIEADKSVAVDIDAPAMIDDEDEYQGKAIYHIAQGKGTLIIKLPDGSHYEGEVEGNGIKEFSLPGPGTIEVELTSPIGSDSMIKKVEPQVSEKVTVSALTLLDQGEELTIEAGKKVFVYGSVKALLSDSIRSLIQYPFGCAEQTSAKLCGLASAWKYGETTHEVAQMIDAGLSRMTKFLQPDGLYSLWENSKEGSADVTKKVLKNLTLLIGLTKFKDKTSLLIEKPVQQLLNKNVKDNSLLALSEDFRAPIVSNEDAANLAIYSKADKSERQEALRLIESNAIEGSGGTEVHWEPSQGTWGGSLETTAMALRAVCTSQEQKHQALFKKGFKFLVKRLVGGRLYSTADTRALIELFSSMKDSETQPKFTYRAYAKEDPTSHVTKSEKDYRVSVTKGDTVIPLDDVTEMDLTVGGRKLAAQSRIFVRTDGTETMDYKKVKSNFNFEVKLEKATLRLGERIKLTLTPKENSICPISKIFLPANTAFLEGGVNIQTISKPVTEGSITLDIVATSRGSCKLYALLYDMYDSEMIGVGPAIEVRVQ